jgi:DNA-binding CsgD family transcriptional regulator
MNNLRQKNRFFIMVNMVIVFGWLLSFPYQGPVLYAMIRRSGTTDINEHMITVFFIFIGLFCGSFISKNIVTAKRIIIVCTGMTLALSLLVPFVNVKAWLYIIPTGALLAGIVIPVHGRLIKAFIASESRHRTIADLLIGGNVILVIAHIFANNFKPIVSYSFIEMLLIGAFIAALNIDLSTAPTEQSTAPIRAVSVLKSYWMLLVFIFVVTINSGLMFSVIYPYFSRFEVLISIYTNIPYIMTIYFISRLMRRNKHYLLYLGLALWGITFILFTFLGQSVFSFLIIFTLMLTAAGIFDMFWASIMVDNFEHVNNPSALYGLGLSVNVFGVWTGGILGNHFLADGIEKHGISLIGLFVVMISMLIILPLNNHLANQLDYNEFVVKLNHAGKKDLSDYFKEAEALLTKREFEVFTLLISGKTDTLISEALFISLHTIKTHNRNIYKKLKVSNRVELIQKIATHKS